LPNYLKTRLYHNNGDSSFTSVTEGSLVNEGAGSWGCAWGDYDNDGYQDLFVANTGNGNLLYHNNGGSNNWITIKCIGTLSNRSAIGAKVRVSAVLDGTPQWQLREISGGSGLSSQNDLRAAFGVRQARRVDLIRIEWPSGIVQELSDIAVNQLLTVTEPPSQLRGEHLADGAFRVKLIGQKARGYELIASTDLVQWVSLTNLWNSTGTIFYTDPASTNFAQRFYQVVTR
jgi:hypothetical protein